MHRVLRAVTAFGALGVAVSSCASRQMPLVGVSSTVEPAEGPLAAFVVYTRTFKTILVPKEKTGPVVVMDGLWLLGADRIARIENLVGGSLAPEGMRCSVIPPGPTDRKCELPDVDPAERDLLVTVEARLHHAQSRPSKECACYLDDTAPPEDAPAPEESTDHPACHGTFSDLGPVALTGGKLYSVGIADNGGCSGAHLVSVEVEVEDPLLESKTPGVSADARCVKDLPGEEYSTHWAGATCEDPGCCDFAPNPALVLASNGGAVASYDLHADNVGALHTRMKTAKLSPEACPGPFDPCGTGAAFPKDVQDGNFWATTDESAALFVTKGHVTVYVKDAVAPTRSEPIPPAAILGVRYHADAGPLLRRIQREAALLTPHG